MDKKRIELIITVILILIFILTLSNSFKKIMPKISFGKPQASKEAVPVEKAEPLFAVKKARMDKAHKEAKGLTWGRDPFYLQEIPKGAVDTISSLKLMGITVGVKTKPIAIINNEMVNAGSTIGKFKVLKILPDKVIVSDGEKSYDLNMAK